MHGWRSTHTVVDSFNDDMPFLVDSITMELNRHGLTVHRTIHPVMRVRRGSTGYLQEILPHCGEGGGAEAFMHFEVDRQSDPAFLGGARPGAPPSARNDVRVAVEDWQAHARPVAGEITAGLDSASLPPPARVELDEIKAFLQWTTDGNFTFLGYRDYDLLNQDGDELTRRARLRPGDSARGPRRSGIPQLRHAAPEQRRLVYAPTLLILTKASAHSTVHRPANLDYIGIKRFDQAARSG